MRFLPTALAVGLAVAVHAQSPLVTSLADNNSGGNGTTMFFDLTATNGVQITAFDCNFTQTAGSACGLNVYIRAGTYLGNQLNPVGWSLVSTDTGGITTAGRGLATNVPLTTPICVPAGATIAFALESTNGSGHAYITGTGSNQTYSNADLTLDAGSAGTSPVFGGGLNDPRVFSGAVYYTPAACTTTFPTFLVGVGEPTQGSGTLSGQSPQPLEDNWNLRLSLDDPAGTNAGRFGAMVVNTEVGGSPAIGTSALIPGFRQLWAGSTPAGLATIFNTSVGGPDLNFNIPPGLFSAGDVARFQGLVLDRAAGASGSLPVVPTGNTIEFVHRNPVTIEIRCEGANTFNSVATSGFFSIVNNGTVDIVDMQFDWVSSPNGAQATMEFDTDQTGMGDLFEGGNSALGGCAGTYRNGSDAAVGLVYDAANTVPATPCDAAALTGWTGTNAGNGVDDWRTLDFRFTSFSAGRRFEFDADTDGGAGIGGDDMDGMVVTITLADSTVLSGTVQATGTDLGELFF